MKTAFSILFLFLFFTQTSEAQYKVTFRLITNILPDSVNVYITGSRDELGNWNPHSVPLQRINDTLWQKAVTLNNDEPVEYKFTLGIWESEALDDSGAIPPNHVLNINNDTTVNHTVRQWRKQFIDRKLFIDMSRFQRVSGLFFLSAPWFYSPYDSMQFADTSYDDSNWEELQTFLTEDRMPKDGWNGSGWFRIHVIIDSVLQTEPLGLMNYSAGSMEIYLDGELLYAFGDSSLLTPGITVEETFYPKDFSFGKGEEHLIAVRFFNDDIEYFHNANSIGGFNLYIYKMGYLLDRMIPLFQESAFYQYFFSALAIGFGMLQLLLYIFLPHSRSNLIFGLFLIAFALGIYFEYQLNQEFAIRAIILDLRLFILFQSISYILLLLFLYSVFYDKIPKLFYPLAILMAVPLALKIIHLENDFAIWSIITVGIVAIEEIRIIISGIIRKTKGVFFIASGYALLFIFSLYDILIDFDYIEPVAQTQNAYFFGLAGMILMMSVYLAIDIADSNKRAIEQERLAEKRESERKILQERDETKNKLFSVIAHDLKSPFATLIMLTETLSVNYERFRDERRKEYVNNIHSFSRHIGNLIENLLDWSRTQLGRITIKPEPFRLIQIIEKTFELEYSTAQEKNISLVNDVDENITVNADKNTVQTVLRNLTTNAIKFTNPGGRIAISVKENGPFIIISVNDNGIGMDAATKDKLFKEADTFTTRGTKSEKGTGLGLLLCKEFIEKNGGKIWVESEPGKGSSFIFSLPKA